MPPTTPAISTGVSTFNTSLRSLSFRVLMGYLCCNPNAWTKDPEFQAIAGNICSANCAARAHVSTVRVAGCAKWNAYSTRHKGSAR